MRVKWPSFFMTDLINSDDPQFFEQTSDIPYDRHYYKVVTTTNEYIFDDYAVSYTHLTLPTIYSV